MRTKSAASATLFACLALTGLSAALAQPEKVIPEQQAPEGAKYFCPMKCEGEKTYDAAGRCPVCKMKLKPVAPAPSTAPGVTLESPKAADLKPGQPTDLTFKITSAPSSMPTIECDLVIFSGDLAWTEHAHARLQGSRLVIRTQLPHAGEYTAAVLEEGKSPKPLAQGKFTVQGETPNAKPIPAPGSTADAGNGYKVTAFLKQTSASKESTLEFTVTREGDEPGPVSLKAGAVRLFLLSADLREGIAVKAEPFASSRPTFKIELPKAAQYRAILEFEHEGKTRRALCTIDAS